jgi:hypothetical protein
MPLRFEDDSEVTPPVVRTCAGGEDYLDAWSRLQVAERRAIEVHAADLSGGAALCGKPLTLLEEFGRRQFPFEQVPHEDRCRVCDELSATTPGA